MSKKGREEAIQTIEKALKEIDQNFDCKGHAGYILNQLLKGGFLNEKARVHAKELGFFDKAFVCRGDYYGDDE